MMSEQNGVADLSGLTRKVDLEERREELEKQVKPHISQTKTQIVIQYRGKTRYLKPSAFTLRDVYALQAIYKLQTAAKAGDIDRLIEAAIMFGAFDSDVEHRQVFGIGLSEAAGRHLSDKAKRKNTRLGKSKLKEVPDTLLKAIFNSHRDKGRYKRLSPITREINAYLAKHRICNLRGDTISVKGKTVREELRARGIWE